MRHAATRHFVRHYLEMLAAMGLGMLVLGGLAMAALGAAGLGRAELNADVPALMLLGMAVTMTGPMVAWMRHRGHGWPASAEMSAAMFAPAFAAVALLGTGLIEDLGTLMLIEHVAMLPAMLAAMLWRRGEYSGAPRHRVPA